MDDRQAIFTNNLKHYLNLSGKSQKEISAAIDVLPSTFNTWMQGKALPRMGKLQLLADYFNINISDLLEEPKPDITLSVLESELIRKFRTSEHQDAILLLLGLSRNAT